MLEKYLSWDKAFEKSIQASKEIDYEIKTDKIYFSGMGGSYIPGKIAEIFDLNADYQAGNGVPRKLDKSTTLISMSYSGNTSETIFAVKKGLEANSKIIVITSGGYLEKLANENHEIYLVKISGESQTRYSFPYLITPLLKILSTKANEKINLNELKEGITEFKEKFINFSKYLSDKIISKIPVFYGSTYFPIAIRFKQEINENVKYPAFYGYIPEVNHNEVESYVRGKELLPIVIGNEAIDNVTRDVLNAEQIVPPSESKLKNISSLVFLAGVTSIQLSEIYKENPEKLYNIPKCRELTSNIFK
ncbi:bifunctional phosphoglucose/phosphomannose isomerase [Acidianus manzaensis]|uniref:Bifunctional phosphoglucose/phosphomannose isomerase n=1 Tax=Acidianus manzaensis TaxID=282676 RepID=A0A1W6JZJ6_9CREN|nr:bifunctional phosphoglucose/phosphomannose isomerase [Acidianus manzaensis]ARM75655.1 bifunctional phosphoglucose/phosphomannose isomerase [Acidianus manzaensis]